MTEQEKARFEQIVHNLRSQGWSKLEAEDEALNKIETSRVREEAHNPR